MFHQVIFIKCSQQLLEINIIIFCFPDEQTGSQTGLTPDARWESWDSKPGLPTSIFRTLNEAEARLAISEMQFGPGSHKVLESPCEV